MDYWFILLLALIVDALIGDPPVLYRAIPHPVVLIGRAIARAEQHFNQGASTIWRFSKGLMLTVILIVTSALFGWCIELLFRALGSPVGDILLAILASSLLAGRSLYDHVKAVAIGLRQSLAAGRLAVSHIVGRDPQSLDEAGVARAAIESTAENFSDGVVAPAFWFVVFGLPGLCAYKAINTLDSMIGHRNERYESFGKATARIDDVANWLPARLSGLLLVFAAYMLPTANGRNAWRIMWRDAGKHRSPNAGWPEAALAGGLGFALAGPRRYVDHVVDDPWVGGGRAMLAASDIDMTLHLYVWAGVILLLSIGIVGLILK